MRGEAPRAPGVLTAVPVEQRLNSIIGGIWRPQPIGTSRETSASVSSSCATTPEFAPGSLWHPWLAAGGFPPPHRLRSRCGARGGAARAAPRRASAADPLFAAPDRSQSGPRRPNPDHAAVRRYLSCRAMSASTRTTFEARIERYYDPLPSCHRARDRGGDRSRQAARPALRSTVLRKPGRAWRDLGRSACCGTGRASRAAFA